MDWFFSILSQVLRVVHRRPVASLTWRMYSQKAQIHGLIAPYRPLQGEITIHLHTNVPCQVGMARQMLVVTAKSRGLIRATITGRVGLWGAGTLPPSWRRFYHTVGTY